MNKCEFYLVFSRNFPNNGTIVRRSPSQSNNRWHHCRLTRCPISAKSQPTSMSGNTSSERSSERSDHSGTIASTHTNSWTRYVSSLYISLLLFQDFCCKYSKVSSRKESKLWCPIFTHILFSFLRLVAILAIYFHVKRFPFYTEFCR